MPSWNRIRAAAPCAPQVLEQLEARRLLAFDPTPSEQYMLELLNRMRTDPAAELGLLTSSLGTQARSRDEDVDAALRFFKTKGTVLGQQWGSLAAAPPLAWNEDLYEAAEFHSEEMIERDGQEHQFPGEPGLGQRAENAGYAGFSSLGESIYAYARSIDHGHAGFALDWGDTATGIQQPPGHRNTMMSPAFREVGIRVLTESDGGTEVGPLVITQDFGARFSQGNPYLLGVVYDDRGTDGYSVGEGIKGVQVRVERVGTGPGTTVTTTTMTAGGWQVQVPAGSYNVTFSGGVFGTGRTYRNVTVGSANVKLDAPRDTAPPEPEIAIFFDAAPVLAGDTRPSSADGTNFGAVNLAQSAARLFTVRNTGRTGLALSGADWVRVTGPGASSFVVSSFGTSGVIPAGGSAVFQVVFDPQAEGAQRATITVRSDDADEGEYAFAIQGRGQDAPDLRLVGLKAIADGDRAPTRGKATDFGGVEVALGERTRTYFISNAGSEALTFSGRNGRFVTVDGTHDDDFEVVSQPPATVPPGGFASFTLRFNPGGSGERVGVVKLRTDDPDSRVYDFAVRGKGINRAVLQVALADLVIEPSTTAVGASFGPAGVGGGIVPLTFTVRNVGSAALDLSGSGRVRTDGEDFGVVRQPRARIRAGDSATFVLRFDPSAAGLRQALVTIGRGGMAQKFIVAGEGVV